MPEPNFMALYSFTPEPPKHLPTIKCSGGIGDTDGFPAFDVDSDAYSSKDDSKWGFLITGGAEFHMPLTVFQVTPDGLADKGGIRLGDIILEINEEDATQLSLSQAHEKINASAKKIFFVIKSMDDEEPMDGYEPGEEREIVLRVPKPMPPPPVSGIEKRLQDLQRKLSEIAEIPKILSSTLATVTQTFDKLTTNMPSSCQHLHGGGNEYYHHLQAKQQKRKLSYDEDVYDYELSDEDDNDDDGKDDVDKVSEVGDNENVEEEFNVKLEYLKLKRYAARQRRSKEVTPESDYASENNYSLNGDENEESDKQSDVDDDEDDNYVKDTDDDDNICDMYEQFNLSVLKTPLGHDAVKDESDVDDEVVANDDDDEDDNDDFLTTTFTWNLRNKPKLQINGRDNQDETDLHENQENDNSMEHFKSFNNNDDMNIRQIKEDSPEKPHKLDKLERCWPWADREKIIYKQSTCHLVPHKPLGLIGQRIQLLAKRNVLEHLNKSQNSQQ